MPTTRLHKIADMPIKKLVVGERFAFHRPTLADVKEIIRRLEARRHEPDTEITVVGHDCGWVSFGLEGKFTQRSSSAPKGDLRKRIEHMEAGEQITFDLQGDDGMAIRVAASNTGKTLGRTYRCNKKGNTLVVTRAE